MNDGSALRARPTAAAPHFNDGGLLPTPASAKRLGPDDSIPRPKRLPLFTAGALLVSVGLLYYLFQQHHHDALAHLAHDNDGHNALDPQHMAVVWNVTLHTMADGEAAPAAGVLVRKGEVVRVLATERDAREATATLGAAGATIVDGMGAVVVPGLTDAHGHLIDLGFSLIRPSLVNLPSIEAVRATLRAHILDPASPRYSASRWLRAHGWDNTKWTDARGGPGALPTAADLDSDPVLREVPLVLQRVDVHGYVLNQRAIDLLGDRVPAQDPVGGFIARDSATGRPAGMFMDSAMGIVDAAAPPLSAEDVRAAALKAQDALLRVGVTGMHNAGTLPPDMRVLTDMDVKGELKVRVYAMVRCPSTTEAQQSESQKASREDLPAPFPTFCADAFRNTTGQTLPMRDPALLRKSRLLVRSVKLFLDGALGSHGAALIEPYSDVPGNFGIVICSARECPELRSVVRSWHAAGWQLNIHAIGDWANRLAVQVLSEEVGREARPRIEHAQIMTLDDVERAGKAGIIPSMQPTHATSDMAYAHIRLGIDRLMGAYAWRSLLQAGVPALALGSDFPVEPECPLRGMYAAVARADDNGNSPHGTATPWFANEALTPRQALRGFTRDAAYAAFAEDYLGTIRPGTRADFTVLDRNPLDTNIVRADGTVDVLRAREQILRARVVATVVDGVAEYVREDGKGVSWAALKAR